MCNIESSKTNFFPVGDDMKVIRKVFHPGRRTGKQSAYAYKYAVSQLL